MKQTFLHRILPALWIAALVLPSLVWILRDRQLWTWDPAYYGDGALRLAAISGSVGDVWHAHMRALSFMPPLIVWLGQFFVPLRHITGDIESALLLLNVVTMAVVLAVVFRLCRKLAGGDDHASFIGLAAATLCGGAPLLVGLGHYFLTEPLQALAAAVSATIAFEAEKRSLLRNAALAGVMLAVSLLAKASSVILVLPALAYMTAAGWVTRHQPKPPAGMRDKILVAFAAFSLVATIGWYQTNWRFMIGHVEDATSVGGADDHLLMRIAYWLTAAAESFSLSSVFTSAVVALLIGVLIRIVWSWRSTALSWEKTFGSGALFGLYNVSVGIFIIVVYAFQSNREPRYLAPLIPLLAIGVGWMLAAFRNRILTAVVLFCAISGAAVSNSATLGLLQPIERQWLAPADHATGDRALLARIVAQTCENTAEPRNLAVAVSYATLNSNNAMFTAAAMRFPAPNVCTYYQMPQSDVTASLRWLDERQIQFVITLAPDRQPPPDYVNGISRAFAEAMAIDPRFARTESIAPVEIYRRK